MKTLTINDMENIPTSANAAKLEITDQHNGGIDTIEITGLWVINNTTLAIDLGEHYHCLNDVVLIGDEVELSSWSVGGTYNGNRKYYGNGSNDVTDRIVLEEGDTMDDLVAVVKHYSKLRLDAIQASK